MTLQQDPRGLSALTGTIERRGLRDHVYERILQLLLSGDVAPGARLSIDTIARQLEVSPTPVREAMVQLERTGLVSREALKGYRVAPLLKPSQLAELFDARLMLEATAARLATPASAAMVAELRDAQEHHRSVGEQVIATMASGDTDVALTTAYFAADAAFHRVVFDHCRNHYLTEMSDALAAQLHRMRQAALHGVTDVREAIAEHAAIVEAFAGDDSRAPERAMRRHIELVRSRSLDVERG
ncbi:GntR family transcriptional regulator [Microbacterium sp. zg.Y1090]|uniref:GntR family transcriptional regulator n=1 Tax=Microbacterium TaxID=33882 RepID=UPI00214C2667|nr:MULTISPECIES: GntR family transcriptional regulator [unclassified Microbacterium]MCR2813784.1 GntR family transcriptional regulator [Microbacterium sp. zg.Y1084]MCR2819702.1 GntR family transcriptional regulator [Microbacterium sp. zg.Y1090]MDL5487550.1 GntR family transcriptional regulator [Microbacterium sp. zg-Y1211]WIM28054.1 GntR family transcriptional regulator [Microbacterium sp. zg-Y1090]